jgi:hypothetical protein
VAAALTGDLEAMIKRAMDARMGNDLEIISTR